MKGGLTEGTNLLSGGVLFPSMQSMLELGGLEECPPQEKNEK